MRIPTTFVRTTDGAEPMGLPTPDSPAQETPATLACIFGVITSPGCNKMTLGNRHPVGGWGAIALVYAYANPTAVTDIVTFAATYGLPTPNFTKIKDGTAYGNMNCTTPPPDQGWAGARSIILNMHSPWR